MRIYRLKPHRSRAQVPDIDSRRNGWLREFPALFEQPTAPFSELVTSSEKFAIA
jgi:hypothetical protein